MEDTDWRPSPCPECGQWRDAAKYPICMNKECKYFYYKGDINEKGQLMKSTMKYLWVKEGRAPMIVSDLIELYKDRDFIPDQDKLYEIGHEIKLQVEVKAVSAHPVTRGAFGG